MKQSKTFASGFPVEETIESLRQQLAEKDAEIERLEEERDDALQGPWAEWAEKSLKIIREHTGYDGYDDQFDGVNLPNELAEAFNEFEAEEERLRQQLAEARQEIADRKSDCETGHDQDEATIAELCQQLAEKEAQIVRLTNLVKNLPYEREDMLWELISEKKAVLALPQDTTALSAMITKAGEVMRERCAVECETHYNFSNALAAAIRAIQGVTLKDIK